MLRRLFDLVYAPLSAALLLLLLVPLCSAVILGPTLASRREIGRAAVRLLLTLLGVPLRVRGLQNLPRDPSIAVANHASYMDGLVLAAALPRRYTFVVQHGAARWPLVGLMLRRMGVVFVNRQDSRAGARQTRLLIRHLENGESLAVFVEGTFREEAGLLAFKTGAFLMAARARAPVVPVAICGTRRFYGGGRRLPRWSPLEIRIRKPIMPQGNDRPAALILRDAARAELLSVVGEPDLAHHVHGH